MATDEIIRAYDEAYEGLIQLKADVVDRIWKLQKKLLEARKEAILEARKKEGK